MVRGGFVRPEYCEAIDEDTPCVCGATKEGNDLVRGVCQARIPQSRPEPYLRIILTHRDTGEPI